MASSLPENHPQTEIEEEGSPSSLDYHRPTSNIDTSSASASASTAANPNNNHPYDIFINHRGPDTKKNFASHLYRRFLLYGYRVFLDKEELRQGDNFDSQIKAAIRSASVHVAIFSPRYAESRWCLEELCLMLQTGATLIPVFYNVQPSHLRWTREQKGVYGEALHIHEQKKRYDSVTLENWRDALSRVADKNGFLLEKCNSDEGELLDKVVECVLKNVKRLGLNAAKYPTGLDEKVKDFEKTVLSQQNQNNWKPHIVGIVGLGGVGKTTLAKELFNRKRSDYRSSCFLFDVRDNASKGFLNSLQSKLLKGLNGLDMAIDSIDEGIELLKKHLSSSQSLVILDDVDNVNQLDAILPIQTVLSSDSLIIITSRDKAVLRSSGVEEKSIYKLEGLETQHARELFCSHAFSQPHPLSGFESLVDEFIKACHGLPLSLKVMGALLYAKDDHTYWKELLDSLQNTLPSEIQRRLKISYDTLNEEEQQIFLDIVFFFIGEKKDEAIRIWNGSGWKGYLGFQNLHKKCLLELDREFNGRMDRENDRIHMHDHVRDMGREIAKDSNLQLPSRVRLSPLDIDDWLQKSDNEQVPTKVRGIMATRTASRPFYPNAGDPILRMQTKVDCLVSKMSWFQRRSHELLGNRVMKCLDRLLNTRHGLIGVSLLDVEDDHMERIMRRVLSPNVRCIRWYRCPYSFLPSWIPMKDLRGLEVGGSELKTLWHKDSQAPVQLRQLQICGPLSIIPKSIGDLKNLERIIISCLWAEPVNLKKLPDEFCRLQSLKTLVIWRCLKLKSLPDSFGDLINLEHLDLYGSSSLERLPNSFGNLIKLKYLDLRACSKLSISSETLGNISTLEHLDLAWCKKIEALPPQVVHQRSLAKLDLRDTNIKELPSAIADLSDLEDLSLGGPMLSSLPPWLGELNNLKTLYFAREKYQRDFLEGHVSGQREKSTETSLKGYQTLQHFSILGAEMSEISFGGGVCPNLHKLGICDCNNLRKIEGLCGLPKLQSLSIECCHKLKKIEGLCGLAKLQTLQIYNCIEVEELPGVEECRSLKTLQIDKCPKLQFEEELASQLRVQGCKVLLPRYWKWIRPNYAVYEGP